MSFLVESSPGRCCPGRQRVRACPVAWMRGARAEESRAAAGSPQHGFLLSLSSSTRAQRRAARAGWRGVSGHRGRAEMTRGCFATGRVFPASAESEAERPSAALHPRELQSTGSVTQAPAEQRSPPFRADDSPRPPQITRSPCFLRSYWQKQPGKARAHTCPVPEPLLPYGCSLPRDTCLCLQQITRPTQRLCLSIWFGARERKGPESRQPWCPPTPAEIQTDFERSRPPSPTLPFPASFRGRLLA